MPEWLPEKDFATAVVYVSEGTAGIKVEASRMLMCAQAMISAATTTPDAAQAANKQQKTKTSTKEPSPQGGALVAEKVFHRR